MSTHSSAKKKMGRPKVDSEAVNVRMDRELLNRLDDWREREEDFPNRPAAIRRLVERGLDRG